MGEKRFDLPRARVDGTIHNVRPKTLRDDAYAQWLKRTGRWECNITMCGRSFRHATLPKYYQTNCVECLGMTDVDFLKFEVQQLKRDYQDACQCVAEMHAAAVGAVTGPRRGVVEDVEDLRLERDRLKTQCDALARTEAGKLCLELEKVRRELSAANERIVMMAAEHEHLKLIALSA